MHGPNCTPYPSSNPARNRPRRAHLLSLGVAPYRLGSKNRRTAADSRDTLSGQWGARFGSLRRARSDAALPFSTAYNVRPPFRSDR
jgi:hypothetical protein